MRRAIRSAILAIPFLASALALPAQQPVPSFGTTSLSADTISAWDMEPRVSGMTWASHVANNYRILLSVGTIEAGIRVPQGARIVAIELVGCDTAPLGNVSASLYRSTAGNFAVLAAISTTLDGMPGCGRFGANLGTPEVVDWDDNLYFVIAGNSTDDGATSLGAVRVFYELQVSPSPGSPTFGDVPPSDPAFQFIEALVASGVTAGCGSSNYCPDNPVTRRQMAVFLAKLVGLHWPEFVLGNLGTKAGPSAGHP